jgi:hypothetical protein
MLQRSAPGGGEMGVMGVMGVDQRSAARWLLGATAAGVVLGAPAAPAAADATYRTERLALVALGGAPLQAGAVVNAHPNGPRIYEHQQYTLVGAQPNTAYQVVVRLDRDSAACATAPEVTLILAPDLTTNAAGNGTAKTVLTPADVGDLAGTTVGARWQVTRKGGGPVLYQTACTAVALD